MRSSSCPYCSAYKSSAYRLASQVRELEAQIKLSDEAQIRQELERVASERDKLKTECDRLRIERESGDVLNALAVAADELGYGKGQIPSKDQWDRVLATTDILNDALNEYADRIPADTLAVLRRLLGG